jgi:hypothetical protein
MQGTLSRSEVSSQDTGYVCSSLLIFIGAENQLGAPGRGIGELGDSYLAASTQVCRIARPGAPSLKFANTGLD